jgi:hypothetical protein
MSISTYERACATLFRAVLGDEPMPSPHELHEVTAYLRETSKFCAALDQVVRVIVCDKGTVTEGWHTRLQEYITAQLAGHGNEAAFADLRQQLDASVSLSEEYALLYETMQAELQGAVTMPAEISAPDLSFLPESAPVAKTMAKRHARWFGGLGQAAPVGLAIALAGLTLLGFFTRPQPGLTAGAWVLLLLSVAGLAVAMVWHGLTRQQPTPAIPFRLGNLLQALLVLASLSGLVVAWQMDRSSAVERHQSATTHAVQGPAKRSNYAFHMQLEAQLPAHLARYEAHPAPRENLPCIDFQRGLLIRQDCPL